LRKIILIDNKWDIRSGALQYVLKASKGTDTEVAGIFPVDDSSRETVEKAETMLRNIKQDFASEGISFSSYVIGPDPGAFMRKIDDLMPASLVLFGDVKFSDEMVKGGVSIKALGEKLSCPVTTAEAVAAGAHAEKKTVSGINWVRFTVYLIGSIIMYAVFFPMLKGLNATIFMKGTVLGGIAVMVVVAVHAWIWGSTTQILPKLFKLEKTKDKEDVI